MSTFNPSSNVENSNDRVGLSSMKLMIQSMLRRCDLKARSLPMDADFAQKCLNDAVSLGVPLEASPSYLKANQTGAAIAYFAYPHLKSEATKVFIGTYTALIIYIEDIYGNRPLVMENFCQRLINNDEQKTAILEAFAKHLRRVGEHFGSMQANGILIGTMKWVTSLWYEYGTSERVGIIKCSGHNGTDSPILDCHCGFPRYVRGMSGNGEPYVMFMFPRKVPFKVYAQAIPSLTEAINYFNDILSLYKEELAGEDTNFISTMAIHHNTSKSQIFLHLSDQIVRW
ncbi:hypothetical protein ONZ45_g16066 [Pleurotus djamor]|nr:hypothetical protein ONZ45_g16066 [Pleurotus djamor]